MPHQICDDLIKLLRRLCGWPQEGAVEPVRPDHSGLPPVRIDRGEHVKDGPAGRTFGDLTDRDHRPVRADDHEEVLRSDPLEQNPPQSPSFREGSRRLPFSPDVAFS